MNKQVDYKIIAVDFDGTLCENKWPEIGKPNAELIEQLRVERLIGNKVVLWTCRSKELLKYLIKWCDETRLKFNSVKPSNYVI